MAPLTADERHAVGKFFDELADLVLGRFPDAEVSGRLGEEGESAQLVIVVGAEEAGPETDAAQSSIKTWGPPIRHSHPVSGRKNDVLVHTHRCASRGHWHAIAHLGAMMKLGDDRRIADLALAEPVA